MRPFWRSFSQAYRRTLAVFVVCLFLVILLATALSGAYKRLDRLSADQASMESQQGEMQRGIVDREARIAALQDQLKAHDLVPDGTPNLPLSFTPRPTPTPTARPARPARPTPRPSRGPTTLPITPRPPATPAPPTPRRPSPPPATPPPTATPIACIKMTNICINPT